ncbi:MAG TPA: DUF2652 domain-containing protein [Methylomirabilota bacterium]|jgi:hypothetical protein|nr:DUF2652 domain-containing protein [Methylomirabilota bacterium]
MAEQAIVFIPDISGFTDFTSTTEIDHAAHIITELLELLVESNDTGFTLAEVEGDAVLFYRTGAPLKRERLVEQCLSMFSNFHQRLMVIERDTVCQCGACQTASNLTLKFIAHFGYLKEIKVARFVKATGVDMIVAHRLLKNDVDSSEYILMTDACCEALGRSSQHPALQWSASSQTYDAIGTVKYEFATLSGYRRQIPPPAAPPRFVVEKGTDNLEIVIQAPLKAVYQTLINVDKRPEWLDGVATINREMTSERIGMRHNCVFHGLKLINTALYRDYHEDHARYSENVEIPDIKVTLQAHYEMEALGGGSTRLRFNVNWMGSNLPAENKKGMMAGQASNFELLKKVCENNPA